MLAFNYIVSFLPFHLNRSVLWHQVAGLKIFTVLSSRYSSEELRVFSGTLSFQEEVQLLKYIYLHE